MEVISLTWKMVVEASGLPKFLLSLWFLVWWWTLIFFLGWHSTLRISDNVDKELDEAVAKEKARKRG